MALSTAILSLAVLPHGVIWPLALGALASLVACSAAVGAVIAQRRSSRARNRAPKLQD